MLPPAYIVFLSLALLELASPASKSRNDLSDYALHCAEAVDRFSETLSIERTSFKALVKLLADPAAGPDEIIVEVASGDLRFTGERVEGDVYGAVCHYGPVNQSSEYMLEFFTPGPGETIQVVNPGQGGALLTAPTAPDFASNVTGVVSEGDLYVREVIFDLSGSTPLFVAQKYSIWSTSLD